MEGEFDQLLRKLKELKIIQKFISWDENIPEKIWNKDFANDNYEIIVWNLYPDKHRWYETSVAVIKIYNRFLGIRHISNLFSESSSCEDCFVEMEFYEMEEFVTTSYRRKDG